MCSAIKPICQRSLQPACTPFLHVREASGQSKHGPRKDQEKKKKKPRTTFVQYDLRDADQFALCDAMR